MKLTVWRVLAFFLLLALSVGFGFGFDAAATAFERHRYPLYEPLVASVAKNAEAYGVPEPIVWATVKCGSDFASNAVSENGAIGLTRLTPAQFAFICTELLEKETPDTGMLYDPETNLQAGCAYLSYLFGRYGVWEHAFAAYAAGTDTVDAWLAEPDRLSEQGVLTDIPDAQTARYVREMNKTAEFYTKLYYEL